MSGRVCIVGIGQTHHRGPGGDLAYHEFGFHAAKAAMEDAGLTRGDIDTVLASGWDVLDGRTISDMHLVPAAGGYLKDSAKVADDGILAFAYAYMRIASGAFDTALVMGHGHAEAPTELVSNVAMDPFFYRPLGMSATPALALQASSYASRYGVGENQAAAVVEKNRRQGANNSCAHLQKPVTREEVLSSEMVAWPLHALDCAPKSVGAVALVLCSEDRAKRISARWATVEGIGWATSSYHIGAVDLWRLDALAQAAEAAYAMAGIDDPLGQLDVAEIHDVTSYHELMTYEALGWAPEGGAAALLEQGATSMGGRLPVNPSGGALSTNIGAGTGLVRVAEAALQVLGRADGRQVEARTALAHGVSALTGSVAQTHGVVVLRGR
ncbi:MAG: thiolase family protein [Dehalococcoidia bacterium]|nr:thiolase family protein [Dehalococcoidia bacterium]